MYELPPEIVAFAGIQGGLWDVPYPFDRLRIKVPVAHWPFFVTPGKSAQARGGLLRPYFPFARIGSCRRGIENGDPSMLGAPKYLETANPAGSPMTWFPGRLQNHS